MFADIFEHLRDGWRSTVKPVLQNLLSEKRNLISLFIVMLLLQTVLGILFLSFSGNRAVEREIKTECEQALQPRGDPDEATEAAFAEIAAKTAKITEMNIALFVLSLLVWFAVSSFIISRLIASSVELKKMIYGLYIVFGADTRKIRRMIFWQMMILGVSALPAAILLALFSVRRIYGFLPAKSVWVPAVLLTAGTVMLLLTSVIGAIALRTTANTCVSLLSSSDVSDQVTPPRRSSERLELRRPFRIAVTAVVRMRSYYLPLVLSAVLPACVFFSCMSLIRSENIRTGEAIPEYTFVYPQGFSGNRLKDDLRPSLERINGVESVTAVAGAYSDDLNFHLLVDREHVKKPDHFLSRSMGYAIDGVKLLSADPYSLHEQKLYSESEGGAFSREYFGIKPPTEGNATMVYPKTVYGSYPDPYQRQYPLWGNITIAPAREEAISLTLSEKLNDPCDATVKLKLTPSVTVNDAIDIDPLTGTYELHCQRLREEFLILSPVDFRAVTGIDAVTNAGLGIATPPITLAEIGGYLTSAAQPTSAAQTESVYLGTKFAENEFYAVIADPEVLPFYDLSPDTPLPSAPGRVTLVLTPYSLLGSETNEITLSRLNQLRPQELDEKQNNMDRLAEALGLPQTYTPYRVEHVVISDRIMHDTVLLTEPDIAYLFERPYGYSDLIVNVSPKLRAGELSGTVTSLYRWGGRTAINGEYPELRQAGELWDAFLLESCHYNGVISLISLLLLIAIPFIWFCPQYNHYRKRKYDLDILRAIGMRRSLLFRTAACEGLILAGISALATLALCPLFTLAVFLFVWFNGFPFAYGFFDPAALLAVIVFSALCAVGSVLLNYLFLFPPRFGKTAKGSQKSSLPELDRSGDE